MVGLAAGVGAFKGGAKGETPAMEVALEELMGAEAVASVEEVA